jgi:apolipoprotein N-acyltransferase
MRDKWDEHLFWKLLDYYEKNIEKLLGKQLIILPESAIPLPASYLEDYLLNLHHRAIKAKSAVITGILQAANDDETYYHNAIISLGEASGDYVKRHLVPFGEYIPAPFLALNRWLNLPEPNILPGKNAQTLLRIGHHSVASLICYEIAYPNLLRDQLPKAEWIISISDNGWFGHSLASYQQQQMAQFLSLATGRYQIIVNNDGLSSIINPHGDIISSLPSFQPGILQGQVLSAKGSTPWVVLGDYPVITLCSLLLFFALFRPFQYALRQEAIAGRHKSEYPSPLTSLE